jgi:hypothetical protein
MGLILWALPCEFATRACLKNWLTFLKARHFFATISLLVEVIKLSLYR